LASSRGASSAVDVLSRLIAQCRSSAERRAELAYEFVGLTAPTQCSATVTALYFALMDRVALQAVQSRANEVD
jgi:hypothetical protein